MSILLILLSQALETSIPVHVDGGDSVSELRPLTGPLFIPQRTAYTNMDSHGGMILTGEYERSQRQLCAVSSTNLTLTDTGGD
jgi:hypothetical protein